MFDTQKPESPEELVEALELKHFGVPGMKWGLHKTRGTVEFKRRFPTAKARKTEILRARQSVHTQRRGIRKQKDPVKKEKLKKQFLRNPDRATALRMTRGEKIIDALLYGISPVSPWVAPAVAVQTVGIVGRRRKIEADQGRG